MKLSPQRAAALAFFALSAGYAAFALGLEDAVRAPIFALGPRSFPLFVGAAGVVTSIVILLLEPAADASAVLGAESIARSGHAKQHVRSDWRRTLALCVFMLLYAAALPRAGFVLSTAAFLAASFRLLGERRARALIGIPVAIAVAALVLLRGAFGAHLPEPLFEAVLGRLR
jgi:hypothetical protein